jgi:hypothetical protein
MGDMLHHTYRHRKEVPHALESNVAHEPTNPIKGKRPLYALYAFMPHEAIGEDIRRVLRSIILEPVQIGLAVLVSEKDILPPIATLGDVVG